MIRSVLYCIIGAIVFVGCEPVPSDEELNANLVVQTEYDETVNFSVYNTYTMPLDTLGLISNSINDTIIVNDYAKSVTARLKANMDSRGYTWVASGQNPDVGITAFIVNDFTVFQTISYPNYLGGFYSPYYGYYFPIVNTYASNSAILIIQMIDLKQKNAQNQFRVLWSCYIGDVISSLDPLQRSIEAVDQAFAQSPIIGK